MLTVLEVKSAKPKDRPYKLTDARGLFLYVAPSGTKTWRYRFSISGTESTFVLGEYPVLSLESARLKLAEARELVKSGINPGEERRRQKQAVQQLKEAEKIKEKNSFESVSLEWHKKMVDANKWKPDHAISILATLKYDVFPIIGKTPVDQITAPSLKQILTTIEDRGALVIATKVLQRMTAVFRYAIQSGYATYNPATDMKGLIKTRKAEHHPMIKPDELPGFLRTLNTADIHTTTKLAMQFVILTAARTSEVREATWAEIDFDKCLWSIPGERMKMKVPHTVPLSKAALAILNRVKILYGEKKYIFPGIRDQGQPLSQNTMLFAMYRMGYHTRATVHGFRGLFSTIANESGINPDAIERQLAHGEKDATRAAYNRAEYLEERREIMEWYGDYIERCIIEGEAGTQAD